jgi:hypothetical protein
MASEPKTGNKLRWYIYPDYWQKKWGEPPYLGMVYADDEFEATRRAYDKGLLPVNITFGPRPVLAREDSGQRHRRHHRS